MPEMPADNSLRSSYDFIVCGAGSSGSVVAGRLAQNPDVSVLLLEAGGSDNDPAVTDPLKWPANVGSSRDWGFRSTPNAALNGRSTECAMGKGLGGGSAINALAWVQGHKQDWDFIAAHTKDSRWGFEAVRHLYKQIEAWQGAPDEHFRGRNGPVHIEPACDANPLAAALLQAGSDAGIPRLDSYNGRAQEGQGGGALTELIVRNGKRQSIFRSYLGDLNHCPNLTLLQQALVTSVVFDGNRAVGVNVVVGGRMRSFTASVEVILSLGALQTPKVLMQSGLGDARSLETHRIPVVQHLPGVGQNLQDHACFDVLYQYAEHPAPSNNLAEALLFSRSDEKLTAPDLLLVPVEVGKSSPELTVRFSPPANCWAVRVALLQPCSRGSVAITGPNPEDPLRIDTGFLFDPRDVDRAETGIRIAQGLGASEPLARYRKSQVLPAGELGIEQFAREGCVTFHHQTCTASMGTDELSVVDSELRVHGIRGLRIADGSVLPRITRGNTMAPCVVVGERAAKLILGT